MLMRATRCPSRSIAAMFWSTWGQCFLGVTHLPRNAARADIHPVVRQLGGHALGHDDNQVVAAAADHGVVAVVGVDRPGREGGGDAGLAPRGLELGLGCGEVDGAAWGQSRSRRGREGRGGKGGREGEGLGAEGKGGEMREVDKEGNHSPHSPWMRRKRWTSGIVLLLSAMVELMDER